MPEPMMLLYMSVSVAMNVKTHEVNNYIKFGGNKITMRLWFSSTVYRVGVHV